MGERGPRTGRGETCRELADEVESGDTDERTADTVERVDTADGGDRNIAVFNACMDVSSGRGVFSLSAVEAVGGFEGVKAGMGRGREEGSSRGGLRSG